MSSFLLRRSHPTASFRFPLLRLARLLVPRRVLGSSSRTLAKSNIKFSKPPQATFSKILCCFTLFWIGKRWLCFSNRYSLEIILKTIEAKKRWRIGGVVFFFLSLRRTS